MPHSPSSTSSFRMIALDLDGTTLNPQGKVSPRTRDAIQAVVAHGTYVCFATGRNFTESRSVLSQADHYPQAVFVGGASVVDTATGRSLFARAMPPTLARELCHELQSLGHPVLALQDTFHAGVDYLITDGIELDAATAMWMKVTQATVRREADLAGHPHDRTLRVGIVASAADALPVHRVLEEKYADRAVMHSIAVPSQGVEVVEVFDIGVSKWEGIKFIASQLGIEGNEVIAVGDDINDLPMLRQAGLGVAMGNAHPRVKETAKHHIGTNAEDGLAVFLESLLSQGRLAPA